MLTREAKNVINLLLFSITFFVIFLSISFFFLIDFVELLKYFLDIFINYIHYTYLPLICHMFFKKQTFKILI